jgi:hypothetical protein
MKRFQVVVSVWDNEHSRIRRLSFGCDDEPMFSRIFHPETLEARDIEIVFGDAGGIEVEDE